VLVLHISLKRDYRKPPARCPIHWTYPIHFLRHHLRFLVYHLFFISTIPVFSLWCFWERSVLVRSTKYERCSLWCLFHVTIRNTSIGFLPIG